MEQEVGLKEAYQQLWRVIRLPAVQQLALVLFTYRLFMLPAESVAAFKLLEKGVAKDALAGLVRLTPLGPLSPLSVLVPFLPALFIYFAGLVRLPHPPPPWATIGPWSPPRPLNSSRSLAGQPPQPPGA